MPEATLWPRKTRELQSGPLDSTIWNDFPFRDDDIIIATYPKAGTTWLQQIVAQLLFGGDPDREVYSLSPWLDLPFLKAENLAVLAAQTHRRFIKTHLPADALVVSPKARYLYVGRDGRDVVWSLYNHEATYTQSFRDGLDRIPSSDIREFWRDWLDRDGYPVQSFWDNVRSWWVLPPLPNVLMLHFANLKRDLPAEIRRIAAFLEISIDDARWDAILEYCSFAWMKENAAKVAPLGGTAWEGGGASFIHRGVNGRWSETLTPAEVAEYEARAVGELGPECAHWLATGESR